LNVMRIKTHAGVVRIQN